MKPPVSTVHSEAEEPETEDEGEDEADGGYYGGDAADTAAPMPTSAEEAAQRIAAENGEEPPMQAEAPRESKPLLPLYQFRFGDVAFFISKVELDRLNAKYAEYIDTNAALGCSFAEYLLRGVEEHD